MRNHLFLLVVAGVMGMTTIQAEVFRWVDERGKVHFSDRPPGGGARRLEVGVQEPDTTVQGRKQAETERLQQQRRQLDAYREAREARESEQQEAEAKQRQRLKYCTYARNQLGAYQSSRLYEPLADGERRYLNNSERQREIDRMRSEVDRWCDG